MKRIMAAKSLVALVLAGGILAGCTEGGERVSSGPVQPVPLELQERVAREALTETARDELMKPGLPEVAGKPQYRLLGPAQARKEGRPAPVVPMEVNGAVRWESASGGLAKVTTLVHFYRGTAGEIRYQVLREAGTVSWN